MSRVFRSVICFATNEKLFPHHKKCTETKTTNESTIKVTTANGNVVSYAMPYAFTHNTYCSPCLLALLCGCRVHLLLQVFFVSATVVMSPSRLVAVVVIFIILRRFRLQFLFRRVNAVVVAFKLQCWQFAHFSSFIRSPVRSRTF